MTFLHIANANFESELAATKPTTVAALIQSNLIFMQLQFLPLLYAGPEDGIAVTHAPSTFFHRIHLLDEKTFPYENVESWGASLSITEWAKKKNLGYTMPHWNVVKQVNSKAFSFNESQKLPGATLVHTLAELEQWEQKTEGPKVLKSCFGVSGKGHLFLPSLHMKKFAEKEFAEGRPIIAEPWVERKLDFSTQWMIHPNQKIEFLGATICINDKRGQYNSNRVGDLPRLFGKYFPFLETHKETVFPILQKMALLGYFGNVGIDAMIWGNNQLHPVVEINARKTMGWVALEISKRRFPKQTIALSYLTKSNLTNLLPDAIVQKDGSLLHFTRKLVVEVLANKS
ncbi:MAG TPA: hypothetical protein VIJ14_06395 [Rhabdochlamydiaceae bacterium]